jgi:isopropylmalate/homocitrate/citramalate synthase
MIATNNEAPPIMEGRQPIQFTEVTLRDGEQQAKIHDIMPIPDRIRVFDEIINTGINRVEIGHLGNGDHDVPFAEALVAHITEQSLGGDERYDTLELQVLFGSQQQLTSGIDALEGFDKNRVIAHVYDRVSPELRGLATEPYTIQQSAERVIDAAQLLLEKGYHNFSISGEGTVDPNISAETAANGFYIPIVHALRSRGAEAININLPDTFGSSLGGEWTKEGLADFNRRIKEAAPDLTTSIHVHDDHKSAIDVAMAAIEVGFDSVEGTLIGMGERSGNVALVDVMQRLMESGRQDAEMRDRWQSISHIGRMSVSSSIWQQRSIESGTLRHVGNWYQSSRNIAEIYGVMNRFHKTSIGDPESYAAGSGPHAQANQEALRDPLQKPFWKNYGRVALIDAMLGGPVAQELIAIDVDRYRENTLNTHAAGGATKRVLEDEIIVAGESERRRAVGDAIAMMGAIAAVVGEVDVQDYVAPELTFA